VSDNHAVRRFDLGRRIFFFLRRSVRPAARLFLPPPPRLELTVAKVIVMRFFFFASRFFSSLSRFRVFRCDGGPFSSVFKGLLGASGFQLSLNPLKPNPPAMPIGQSASVFSGLLPVDDRDLLVVPNAQSSSDRRVVRNVVVVVGPIGARRISAPWRFGHDEAGCAALKSHFSWTN